MKTHILFFTNVDKDNIDENENMVAYKKAAAGFKGKVCRFLIS